MNYYKEIKEKIKDNEIYERVKDYSKERHRVLTYFEIGKLLYEAGKHYGEGIIRKYAKALERDFNKKYDERNLRKMRQFYLLFSEPKWASPLLLDKKIESSNIRTFYPKFITKLTWTHYIWLLPIKNDNERYYYTNIAIANHLSVRELRNRIKTKEYYRIDEITRNKLINYEETTALDYVKNPILIKNKRNYNEISEKLLQKLILEDLQSFLEELGDGFCYIGNEYKILLLAFCSIS